MAVDYPVFQKIRPLLPQPTYVVTYPDPLRNEPLTHFARRIASDLPSDCFLAGASFGGIIAVEVAPIVRARACFLIGSVRTPQQLPPWLRMWRFLGGRSCNRLLGLTGSIAATIPARLRTKSTVRMTHFSGRSGAWYRWAASAVLDWQPRSTAIVPTIQIHGDADSTFPIRYTDPDIVVRHGLHALSISHPNEVARAISAYIANATEE